MCTDLPLSNHHDGSRRGCQVSSQAIDTPGRGGWRRVSSLTIGDGWRAHSGLAGRARASEHCHTRGVELTACQSSTTITPHIVLAHSAPRSSQSSAARDVHACIATRRAGSVPTSIGTASSTSEPCDRCRRRLGARRGPEQATNAAEPGRSRVRSGTRCERRCARKARRRDALRPARRPLRANTNAFTRERATCVAKGEPVAIRYAAERVRIRAMLDEIRERRIDPANALSWIESNDPLAA
jgi:hypothetical protein